MKKILLLIIALQSLFALAQNDSPERDAFRLELPVDKEHYYAMDVAKSPYFVQPKLLQIYPGEKLNIEAEIKDGDIVTMKVVKDIVNPERTITLSFEPEKQQDGTIYMMLVVKNPFEKELFYEAMMYTPKGQSWTNTSILPVGAKLTGYESWPHPIITLTLFNWKLR